MTRANRQILRRRRAAYNPPDPQLGHVRGVAAARPRKVGIANPPRLAMGHSGMNTSRSPIHISTIRSVEGVVQNLPILGYTNARKPPACRGRI
jgi:hypothetical protein